MVRKSIAFAAYALIATSAYVIGTGEAGAAGCNGVVDQLKWGCAAWDNNNGPQFPHYKAPQKAAQPAPKIAPAHQAPLAQQGLKPGVAPNAGNRIISRDGAGLVGNDGASLIGDGGGTMHRK